MGKRVMSVTGGHTYYFGYNQGATVAWELQDTTPYRGEIYGGKGKIATYKAGLTFFPTQDLVGTVRNNVTQDGSASESCVSLPFGDGQSCFGNAPGQPGPGFFTGQDRDAESNLDHFHFRQYSSNQGRWTVPDPSGMAAVDVTNPQTWNRYAYVANNPLSYVDPMGLNLKPPGECQGGMGICPWEGGGADPSSISGGNYVGWLGSLFPVYGWVPVDSPWVQISPDSRMRAIAYWGLVGYGSFFDFNSTTEGGGGNNGNVSCNSTTGICVPSSMMKPRPAGCGAAVAQGSVSVGLDVLGAIPGLGNAVSATAAGARAVNGVVAYGGAAYGIATGLPDEAPFGAASAGAGLGLTLADAALEGGKVIPALGNFLSAGIGLYDGYQLAKTIQRCW